MPILIFASAEGLHSHHHIIEVNLVGVEFGAVNTYELDLIVYGYTAAAAHSRTVNHNRVK